jgi:hypothetical protein
LISPLAKESHVFHGQRDHSSIPNFIADVFGLKRVGKVHTSASFDRVLNSTPRATNEMITLEPANAYRAFGGERGPAVFLFYLLGLAVTVAAIVLLALRLRQVREGV